jgi:membrane protease subunit (stomatin/prohibitin family)
MLKIQKILETEEVAQYLIERQLLPQYQKCKRYILEGFLKNVDFKIRQPKKEEIYYFRINQQYRALCIIVRNELRVFEIDNHQ